MIHGPVRHPIHHYLPLEAIGRFISKNVVMVVALAAALITCFIVPVDREYAGYFDIKTLTCLFCVLAVVCALKNINFFYILAQKIIVCCRNIRLSILVQCISLS